MPSKFFFPLINELIVTCAAFTFVDGVTLPLVDGVAFLKNVCTFYAKIFLEWFRNPENQFAIENIGQTR